MKDYGLFAFDMDGTLTPSKSPLGADIAKILCRLLSTHKVAVISGAGWKQFQTQFLAHMSCPPEAFKNLYLLPTNGAVFCSYADGWKCEPEYEFGDEEKGKIYQVIEKALAQAGLEESDTLYGERVEDRGQQITFSALGSEAPLEEKERWDPDYAKRLKLKVIIEKDLPDFAVHIGGTTSLDITRKGIDKAYGIRRISEKLGLKFEEILYVADDMEKGSNNATIEGLGVACRQVDNPAEAAKLISDIIGQVD